MIGEGQRPGSYELIMATLSKRALLLDLAPGGEGAALSDPRHGSAWALASLVPVGSTRRLRRWGVRVRGRAKLPRVAQI
jgi:hypothetical protein